MPTPDQADPVGLTEIAHRLDVAAQSAQNWRTRGVLPPARWTVGGRPAWDWHLDIHPWAAATGRLPRKDTTVITSTDIARQVATAIEAGEGAATIDQDAIVRDIIAGHGLVDIDTIDPDSFWALVARHDTTQRQPGTS